MKYLSFAANLAALTLPLTSIATINVSSDQYICQNGQFISDTNVIITTGGIGRIDGGDLTLTGSPSFSLLGEGQFLLSDGNIITDGEIDILRKETTGHVVFEVSGGKFNLNESNGVNLNVPSAVNGNGGDVAEIRVSGGELHLDKLLLSSKGGPNGGVEYSFTQSGGVTKFRSFSVGTAVSNADVFISISAGQFGSDFGFHTSTLDQGNLHVDGSAPTVEFLGSLVTTSQATLTFTLDAGGVSPIALLRSSGNSIDGTVDIELDGAAPATDDVFTLMTSNQADCYGTLALSSTSALLWELQINGNNLEAKFKGAETELSPIYAHNSDAGVAIDGSIRGFDNPVRIGRRNSDADNWAFVMPFELPEIPVGTMISDARLSIEITGWASNGDGLQNLDLYISNTSNISAALEAYYVDGENPSNPYMELADDDFVLKTEFAASGSGIRTSENFATLLRQVYMNGGQPGDYVFFALTNDQYPTAGYRYFNAATSQMVNPPTLSITTVDGADSPPVAVSNVTPINIDAGVAFSTIPLADYFTGGTPDRYQIAPGAVLPAGLWIDEQTWQICGVTESLDPMETQYLVIRAINGGGAANVVIPITVNGAWNLLYGSANSPDPASITPGQILSDEISNERPTWRVDPKQEASAGMPQAAWPIGFVSGGTYSISGEANFRVNLPADTEWWVDAVQSADDFDVGSDVDRIWHVDSDTNQTTFQPFDFTYTADSDDAFLRLRLSDSIKNRWWEVAKDTLQVRGPGANPNIVTDTPVARAIPDLDIVDGESTHLDLSSYFEQTVRFELAPNSDPLPAGLTLEGGCARINYNLTVQPKLLLSGTSDSPASTTNLTIRAYNDVGDYTDTSMTLHATDNPNLVYGIHNNLGYGIEATEPSQEKYRYTLTSGDQSALWASQAVQVEPQVLYKLTGRIHVKDGMMDDRPVNVRVSRTPDMGSTFTVSSGWINSKAIWKDEDSGSGVDFTLYFVPDCSEVHVGIRVDQHEGFFDLPFVVDGTYVEVENMELRREEVGILSESPQMLQSFNYFGTIWTLNEARTVGLYLNGWGQPWIHNPVGGNDLQITQIWPPSEEFGRDLAGMDIDQCYINGAELNKDETNQGFDGRDMLLNNGKSSGMRNYIEDKNIDPGHTGCPITIADGEEASISKGVSLDYPGQRGRLLLRVTTTVVADIPAIDAFMPASAAVTKASPARMQDMNTVGFSPRLETPSESVHPAYHKALCSFRTDHDPWNNTFPNNGNMNTHYMGGYYTRSIQHGIYETAWASLLSAAVPNDEQIALMAQMSNYGLFMQHWIDEYDPIDGASSQGIYPAGANTKMRKPFYALAAFALNDATLMANVKYGDNNFRPFGCDRIVQRITDKLIGAYVEPYSNRVLGLREPWLLNYADWGQRKATQRLTLYTEQNNPSYGPSIKASYRAIDNNHSVCADLAMRLLFDGAIQTQWEHEGLFEYADTNMYYFHDMNGSEAMVGLSKAFWFAYRSAGEPICAHRNGLILGEVQEIPEARLCLAGVTTGDWLDLETEEFFGGLLDPSFMPTDYTLIEVQDADGNTISGNPAWPDGVTLNSSTGLISVDENLTVVTPLRFYIVRGSNSFGYDDARIALQIDSIRLTAPAANSKLNFHVTPNPASAGGTLYWVISTSLTPPADDDIKNGIGTEVIGSGSAVVNSSSEAIQGSEPSAASKTNYFVHWLWEDSTGRKAHASQVHKTP